jgi:hypothetical protein
MKMETARSSEMVSYHNITWCHNPQDLNLNLPTVKTSKVTKNIPATNGLSVDLSKYLTNQSYCKLILILKEREKVDQRRLKPRSSQSLPLLPTRLHNASGVK